MLRPHRTEWRSATTFVRRGDWHGHKRAVLVRTPDLYYGEGAKVDEFQTSSIIYWYEELEERLIEFLKFFPFIPPNKDVSSPRLAGVVTETCHILDSLLREVSNPKETIKGKTKKKEELDVRDYAELYAKRFNLSATKSLMFVSPPQYVIPFRHLHPLA